MSRPILGRLRRSKEPIGRPVLEKFSDMTKSGHIVTSAGAATAGVGWLTTTEMAAVFGAVMAACGFIVTLVYTIRKDKRDREVHKVKVDAFRALCEERSIEDSTDL